jgi:uncharacterized SAM-binding protein YcdF (DUF218 family)
MKEILEAHDSSLEELTVDFLDGVKYNEKYQALTQILKKIRSGGKITIIGTDATLFSKEIINDRLTIEQINNIVQNLQSVDSLLKVEKFLVESGFKIVQRGILEHGKYILSATI